MRHDFRNDVLDIKEKLEKYKWGFPVIKELIQNSNDANATELIIGFTEHTDKLLHPLLKDCPAFYILNNGKFCADDAIAINEAIGSGKADKITTGKFGLGLKSIFHYCEGYFYLCDQIIDSDKLVESEDCVFYSRVINLVTPWESKAVDNPYRSWAEQYTKSSLHDYDTIKSKLKPLIDKWPHWFVLWIPIRTTPMVKIDEYIVNEFWNSNSDKLKSTLFNHSNYINISYILSLMSSLKSVKILDEDRLNAAVNFKGHPLQSLTKINQQYQAQKSLDTSHHNVSKLKIDNKELQVNSFLRQNLVFDPTVQDIYNKRKKRKNEKVSPPHIGVLLVHNPTFKSHETMTLQYSNFLPLSKKESLPDSQYTMFIHGCFYVDSGRHEFDLKIIPEMQDDRKDEVLWNITLFRNALRLIIPSLAEFQKANRIGFDEMTKITAKIKEEVINKDEFVKALFNDLCCDYMWVARHLGDTVVWEMVDNQAYYRLDHQFSEFANLVPHFKRLTEKHVFIGNPDKCLLEKTPQPWLADFFEAFWNINPKDLYKNLAFRRFWLRETHDNMFHLEGNKAEMKSRFFQIIKKIIMSLSFSDIKDTRSEDILSLLVGYESTLILIDAPTLHIWKEFNNIVHNNLVLPLKYKNEKIGETKLKSEDAFNLLQWISNQRENPAIQKFVHKISNDILSQTTPQGLHDKYRDLPLLLIESQDKVSEFISINRMSELNIVASNSNRELCRLTSAAFCNEAIHTMTVYGESADRPIEELRQIISISIDYINKNYQSWSYNNTPERKALLEFIFREHKENTLKEYKQIIRCLFTGTHNPSDFDKLYIFSKNSIWYKIAEKLSKLTVTDYTRVMHSAEIRIGQSLSEYLSIDFIENDKVPTDLLQRDLCSLDLSELTESERNTIYRNIKDCRPGFSDLFRLPIFRNISGEIISIFDHLDDTYIMDQDIAQKDIPVVKCNLLEYNEILASSDQIKKLDADALLSLYLDEPEPVKHHQQILSVLEKVTLEPEKLVQLINVPWIPYKDKAISLNNVFYHHHISNDIRKISDLYSNANPDADFYISIKDLPKHIVESAGMKNLQKTEIWSDKNILENLGHMIEKTPQLNVINYHDEKDPLQMYNLLAEPLKAYYPITLVSNFKKNCNHLLVDEIIIPKLFTLNPPLESQVEIIKALGNYIEHRCLDLSVSNEYEEFLYILKTYLNTENKASLLNDIKLPNTYHKWLPANRLCLNDSLINQNNILEHQLNDLLSGYEFSSIIQLPDPSENGHPEAYKLSDLKDYLNKMGNQIDKNLIGIFLAFLADGRKHWRNWSESLFLKDILNVDMLRVCIIPIWKNIYRQVDRNKVDKEIWKYKIDLNFIDFPSKCQAFSITGTRLVLDAELSLLRYLSRDDNTNTFYYNFYRLDLDDPKMSGLKDLLREALNLVVLKTYDVLPDQSQVETRIWNKYASNEQLSIAVTQKIMLEEMLPLFNRLSIGNRHPSIQKIQNKYKELMHIKAVNEIENDIDDSVSASQFRELKNQVNDLMTDPEIQQIILTGIRKELTTFQYDLKSILFELFQNADDACSERRQVYGKDEGYYFSVNLDVSERLITVMHNGRHINDHQGNIYHNSANIGYSNDLHKMLTLNYSDKIGDEVTGKFGLGFKSIFLATDLPSVVSGTLGFQIKGGVYPDAITSDAREELVKLLPDRDGTVIQAYINEDADLNDIYSVFEDSAFLLPLMAKQIRKVKCGFNTYNDDMVEINSRMFVSATDNNNLLVFSGLNWKLIFKMRESRLEGFDDISPVWVTVPALDAYSAYKFVINADFQLDIGRKQLARNANNRNLVLQIGRELCAALQDLIKDDSEQDNHIDLLYNKLNLTYDGFWESLFSLLTDSNSHSDALSDIDLIFWSDEDANYKQLLENNKVVPNGIAEPYNDLIRLADLEYVIPQYLNCSETIEEIIKSGIDLTKLISEENYLRVRDLAGIYNLQELTYLQIVKALCPEQKMNFKKADYLGMIFHRLESELAPDFWLELSRTVQFLSQADTWNYVANLVNNIDPIEYGLLETFISQSKLLSSKYSQAAQWLFGKLSLGQNQDVITESIIKAKSEEEQLAALKYILRYLSDFREVALSCSWMIELCLNYDIDAKLSLEEQRMFAILVTEIRKNALNLPKPEYSMQWFMTILSAMNLNREKNDKYKKQSIRFDLFELHSNKKIIKLMLPNRYILHNYETAKDVKLSYGNNKNYLSGNKIEGVSLGQDYAEVLFEQPLSNSLISSFTGETRFWLQFNNFSDMSKVWHTAFSELPFENEDSLKDLLPENLEFIFGPPGTGKTYEIAQRLTKLSTKHKNLLVLTPTNAAADEVIKKLLEQESALIAHTKRFGNCTNQELIDAHLVSHSGVDRIKDNILTVTTAIRFPYDGYKNLVFKDNDWDFIVFDEASMLPIHYITYIIHKASMVNPDCKFIIAGDPFQIPPIYNLSSEVKDKELRDKLDEIKDAIEDETIYTMVGLQSFETSPDEYNLSPYPYPVKPLMVQRRSLEAIGELFSQYRYNGKIIHQAEISPIQHPLFGENEIFLPKTISVIKCPVIGGDVYHTRPINKSSTHPYSALLVVEYLKKFEDSIGSEYSVGIICPYRAQADLIKKIMAKRDFQKLDYQVDTVHGFQGGQKDIIFCLFNSPVTYPEGSTSTYFSSDREKKVYMLNKPFIINVGISRARKFLFLLIPDNYNSVDNKIIPGFDNLREINKILKILENHIEPEHVLLDSAYKLEQVIYGKKDYLKESSIMIPHDQVNVYHQPSKPFLFSYDEKTIDVQLAVLQDKVQDKTKKLSNKKVKLKPKSDKPTNE